MSNTIKILMTYDTVTPESAEEGDFADHGFAAPGGWEFSIADEAFEARCERDGREKALADMTPAPEEFDSIEEAIDFLKDYGPFEASCYPTCNNGHCWVTQADGDTDYSTGAVTRLSFHLKDVDHATHRDIIKAVL
jgi:hypothetical protein